MHPQLIEAYGRMPSTREMKVLLKQVDEKYKKVCMYLFLSVQI